MLQVSSSRMLVKGESKSKHPIKTSESCLTVYSAKVNDSFIVYSLLVEYCKLENRNFANL